MLYQEMRIRRERKGLSRRAIAGIGGVSAIAFPAAAQAMSGGGAKLQIDKVQPTQVNRGLFKNVINTHGQATKTEIVRDLRSGMTGLHIHHADDAHSYLAGPNI